MNDVETLTHCRVCNNAELTEVIDLGQQPLANSFLRRDADFSSERFFPLRVMFCSRCHLCQLGEVVSPETLFREYIYFSSGMPSSPHYSAYAAEVHERCAHSPDNFAVEIGSNDGHLIGAIQKMGTRVLGVDPARNIAAQATSQGIETLPEFFGQRVAQTILETRGHASVILGNNVFAHIHDLHDVVRGIRELLAPDGVFILEAPYLVDMFENLTFDTIYHEHLSYLAVGPLQELFRQFGMEICDVRTFPVQGNSVRVYACHAGSRTIEKSVSLFLEKEHAIGLHSLTTYQSLAARIAKLKGDVREAVINLKQQGKKIACYGAPAKGNTLLNYFSLDATLLSYATEELPSKVGLLTPGMHIPVVHIETARQDPPDYYLLLAWNYKDVILAKEREFRAHGGKFIMPVGDARIV